MRTKEEALEVYFYSHELERGATIREYLITILGKLWDEGNDFSSNRPFGNAGWKWDLYEPLIKHGFIEGHMDEDGYIDAVNQKAASMYVSDVIKLLMKD